MKYRFLGDSGLLVSVLAIGSMTYPKDLYGLLKHAFENGINFWDTAEVYLRGRAETELGQALQRGIDEGIWTREDLVIATKIFMGTKDGPNAAGLSRKHLVEGTRASLKRLGTAYVDVIMAHRPETETPMEEVVRAMNFIINQGWAFYWGTSEWSESEILDACAVADRLGLIRPIVEQPQYNLFTRSKVEVEFASLYSKQKTGLMTWAPLASGILTGKYADGIPEKSRLSNPAWAEMLGDISERVAQVESLRPIAEALGCSLAQLAVAWCISNANVTTVILGVKSTEQLDENVAAVAVADKITREIREQIETVLPFKYERPARDEYCDARKKYL